jgi:glycosyltransferase involved in cell wall biosynthesis
MSVERINRRRILMTVDAVGGIWQYAATLAAQMKLSGDAVILAGCGPQPCHEQVEQIATSATLHWLQSPPLWMAGSERDLVKLPSELSHLVQDNGITVVHLNEVGQAAGLALPCPIVAMAHSCTTTWFSAVRRSPPPREWEWHRTCADAGMRQADLVVAPSVSHAQALATCYRPLTCHAVVHNAVTPDVDTDTREEFVFAAGRWWDAGKNGQVLDAAAPHTIWPIIAAGPTAGPNRDSISFRTVRSIGSVANAAVRRLSSRCGVFVSPSIYEPFGLAALEAASTGTPLVLADIPTYRELWTNAALFFPPDNAELLADTLNAVCSDLDLRRTLGEAALRRSRDFTPQRQASAMHAVYDRAKTMYARRTA